MIGNPILASSGAATAATRYGVTFQTPSPKGFGGWDFACTIETFSLDPAPPLSAVTLGSRLGSSLGSFTGARLDVGDNNKTSLLAYGVRNLLPVVGVGYALLRAVNAAVMGLVAANDERAFYSEPLLAALGIAAMRWADLHGATTQGGALGTLAVPPYLTLTGVQG